MRQAFNGVARVLAAAGILAEAALRNELPELILDSAIAGGSNEIQRNIIAQRGLDLPRQ